MKNTLINLDINDQMTQAAEALNIKLNDLEELEDDAALGNGGLGRLAACFLDSMATLGISSYGYGLRYQFGIFKQQIIDGYNEQLIYPGENFLFCCCLVGKLKYLMIGYGIQCLGR